MTLTWSQQWFSNGGPWTTSFFTALLKPQTCRNSSPFTDRICSCTCTCGFPLKSKQAFVNSTWTPSYKDSKQHSRYEPRLSLVPRVILLMTVCNKNPGASPGTCCDQECFILLRFNKKTCMKVSEKYRHYRDYKYWGVYTDNKLDQSHFYSFNICQILLRFFFIFLWDCLTPQLTRMLLCWHGSLRVVDANRVNKRIHKAIDVAGLNIDCGVKALVRLGQWFTLGAGRTQALL